MELPSTSCRAQFQPCPALPFSRPSQQTLHARSPAASSLSSVRSVPKALKSGACAGRANVVQQRRCLRVQAARVADSEPWWAKNNPANMRDIHSVAELVEQMAGAGDRLVIVDFYAQWCGACRSLFPKLCKICEENPDILFLKVDYDNNRPIAKALGIKVLPMFHFYRGAEGKLAAFSASVSKIQRLKDAMEEHNTPRCSLGGPRMLPELSAYLQSSQESAKNNVVMAKIPVPVQPALAN